MEEFNFLSELIGICIECRKEIKPEEKTILIYEDDDAECVVHERKCYSDYSKFLTDPAEIAHGFIIGICEGCAKPVRWKDKFVVARSQARYTSRDALDTTIPQKKGIGFMHTKCANELG
jgi:hypothetical protein